MVKYFGLGLWWISGVEENMIFLSPWRKKREFIKLMKS